MGSYLCSTKENGRYWFNWNCCAITIVVFIHFLFTASNLFLVVHNGFSMLLQLVSNYPKKYSDGMEKNPLYSCC